MGLFEWLGMGAALGDEADARAPKLAAPEKFFDGLPLALLRSALAGDEPAVRRTIAQGANPNAQGPATTDKSKPQLTLLHYAAGVRNPGAMALLVAAGADPLFEPRKDDGPPMFFLIARGDAQMLDALFRLCPMSKVSQALQIEMAKSTIPFHCRPCLEVMFKHGMSPAISDVRNYNLFMVALSNEDLDLAEWLLTEIRVPLDTMTSYGLTPANYVQGDLARYRPGTPTHNRYLKFKAYMERQGIQFPVESSAEWRARMGVK